MVATWQLAALGIARRSLYERARRDGWDQLHHGVWALPGAVDSPMRAVMAAILAVGRPSPGHVQVLRRLAAGDHVQVPGGPPVVGVKVAGLAACWLLGLSEQPPARITLLVPAGRDVARPSGVILRRTTRYGQTTSTVVGLVPVTGVNWTLSDLGLELDEEQVVLAIARALRLRRTSLSSLRRALDQRGRFPGCGTVRQAVRGLQGEVVHSRAERTAREALRALGLHPHHEPLDLFANGRLIAQADIPFIAERLDVEIDGPHHFLPAQATKDRVRDRRLEAMLRWTTVRFTVYEVQRDPPAFAKEVEATLIERRRAAA